MKTRDWSGAFTHIADATARERLHDLIGLGDPAVPRPAHAPAATELEQTIESVHLRPPFRRDDARRRDERGTGCKAIASDAGNVCRAVGDAIRQISGAASAVGSTDADSARRTRVRSRCARRDYEIATPVRTWQATQWPGVICFSTCSF